MYFHQQQQQAATPSPSLASRQHDGGWGRHPFAGPSASAMSPYGQYPPPPQHHHPHHPQHHHHQSFTQSHNSHQSPATMHQQAGGLFIGNAGVSSNGAHPSPPPQRAGPEDTIHWQQQVVKYNACRQASAPHHRARAAAIAGRMNNNKSAISITDPNNPPSAKLANLIPKRPNSSSGQTDDEDDSSPRPRPSSAVGHPSSTVAPAGGESSSKDVQPWNGLDLGGIHLKTLAPSLFAFSHITSLYINHNSLTTLPSAVSSLRKLVTLDATGNQLRSIPPELGMLTCLKDLLLFDNQLSDLPPELGTLFQLETLGIAGNPLPDSLRLILEKDGSSALVTYLRDSCPVPLPPPDREWATIEADSGLGSDSPPESFTLLCYNILCERYATSQTYGYTPGWALAWDYRKELILQEVMGCGADFICLQEVDEEQYNDCFLANLSKEGYEGAFFPKTRARTMNKEEKKYVDGCATFWKSTKYNLVEKRVIEFNQVALQRPDMRKSDDMFNRVMSKDHVAVVCLLENPSTGSRLIIANVHIEWNQIFRDVKLVQTAMLVEEIEKIAAQFAKFPPMLIADPSPAPPTSSSNDDPTTTTDDPSSTSSPPLSAPAPKTTRGPSYSDATKIPLVICGDFNSVPGSGVYEFLSSGQVPRDHEDFMDHVYGVYTEEGLSHKLGLKSAYSSIGELSLTNFTPSFEGVIDYIWYSTNSLAVTSLLGEIDPNYLSKVVGFPNAHFPSDHVPIFADFKFRPTAPTASRTVTHSNDRNDRDGHHNSHYNNRHDHHHRDHHNNRH